jgi:hypothetical protein
MENFRLHSLIGRFLAGESSTALAKEIESEIILALPENHPAQEVASLLAQFSLGGGQFLYSEQDMARPLQALLSELESAPNNALN